MRIQTRHFWQWRARAATIILAAGLLLPIPTGVVDGDMFVSSRFSNNILRYDQDTGAFLGVFAQGPELLNPNGIAFGPDQSLYVGLGDAGSVLRYDAAGVFQGEFVAAGSGGLGGVRDIIFGPDGDLYVASGTTDQVLRYNGTTGAFVGVAAQGNGLNGPVGLAFGPQGDLFVGAALSNQVFVFDDGLFEMAFNAGPTHSNAVGLVFNPAGELLVAQSVTGEVLEFDPLTGNFEGVFAAGPPGIPIYMEISGGILHVGAFQTDSVWRFNATTGALIDQFVLPGLGGLNGTHDIAFSVIPEPDAWLILAIATCGMLLVSRRAGRRQELASPVRFGSSA